MCKKKTQTPLDSVFLISDSLTFQTKRALSLRKKVQTGATLNSARLCLNPAHQHQRFCERMQRATTSGNKFSIALYCRTLFGGHPTFTSETGRKSGGQRGADFWECRWAFPRRNNQSKVKNFKLNVFKWQAPTIHFLIGQLIAAVHHPAGNDTLWKKELVMSDCRSVVTPYLFTAALRAPLLTLRKGGIFSPACSHLLF